MVISKIFEGLIKLRINESLNNVNILQAGSRKNRGGPDNVFLLRGTIDHHIFTKKPLYITAYDFEQAFDSLWVEDCMLALKKVGISQEMAQLIYNLNKSAKVIVNTPFGPTSAFLTEPIVKQGTVLGSILCSTATGEYCDKNLGVMVGTLLIATLLYVDDIIDLSSSRSECINSHENAITFSRSKKLTFSGTKCLNMVINPVKNEDPVELVIDDEKKVVPTSEIVYLGDVFNNLGNNDGLIKDRVRRGTKAMISISSLMTETDVGRHKIDVFLLLYFSLFLATVLFNSQTWSKLRKKDLDQLKRMQTKFLKRVVGVAYSTCNAFMFLELGVLPIEYEIDKRRLMYLHRILGLDKGDPVYKMLENMISLSATGEHNWWTDMEKVLHRYNVVLSLSEIAALGKGAFRAVVKKAVEGTAFEDLVAECAQKKKTQHLTYQKFETQQYLKSFYPQQSKIIFKCRSQTLDIKQHLSYKYDDMVCRGCGLQDETLEHVINCQPVGSDVDPLETIDFSDSPMLGDKDSRAKILRCTYRVNNFLDLYT